MSSRFFTNHGEQTLLGKFQGIFENNPDIECFDALIGYLRASGYFAIRPHLEKVPHIRILVGINVDAIMADYHRRGLLFLADPTKALDEFREWLRKDIQSAEYKREIETGVIQFVDDVISKKIELRAHPTKRLHAKLYIFRPKGFNEHKTGAVITGSSNLTGAGIGVEDQVSNYEFNVLLHDFADVQFATEEFENLWKESVEILPKFLKEVRDSTYLAAQVTPYELYYKMLLEYFGQSIEYDPNAITDMPEGYKRLTYQVDAVTSGFRLLEKHGGFFLADVVGLGKTMIATLIAKKFFFYNGFPDHRSHTLIVVPPAVEDSWRDTAKEQFRLDNCDIITNGSLHKIKRPEKYDLVIVDEAHKFRNDTADAFDELQRICKSPTQRFLPDGSRASKRVILVTATPLNNRPDDIRNLISLFQDLKDSTLSIANLQHFFARCQKAYLEAHRETDPEVARQKVKAIYELIRTKIISEVTVRRTRNDLMEHDDYKLDLANQGVVFPHIEPPRKILYPLSPALESLYDRTMLLLSGTGVPPAGPEHGQDAHATPGLTYNRYRAIGFLKPEKKKKYQNADRISAQLAVIMRTLLVKRLDSSFHAFKESLRRFRDATGVMRDMFARGTIYIAPNLNVTEFLLEGREEELIAKIQERQPTDPTIEICSPSDFQPGFTDGLESDWQRLDELYAEWKRVEEDPKLDEFLRHLKDGLFDPKINRQHKLVVFSESKETTAYLLGKLTQAHYKRVLTVSSENRAERMPLVRANFDANFKEQANDYDILISTEVLAEGVNLHRANVIVNYDTPWNSTRLMQRVGRVNRIGSVAPNIYIYNFYPTAKVDDDIELKKKAIMKLQAFHTALGEDSQIYSETEEVDNFGLFERSPEEEERDQRLALLMELRQFRQQNPEEFRRIKGLPLRARVGRAHEPRAGSTVTFIRSQRRDAFYRIKSSAGVPPMPPTPSAAKTQATGESPVPQAFPTLNPNLPIDRRQGAYLPHWTQEGATYAVCFRLADSLPQEVLNDFKREREVIEKNARQQGRSLTEAEYQRLDELHSERVETYLDASHGACWLKRDVIGKLVLDALMHFNGQRYRLAAWCVMPNHVHVVVLPLAGYSLSSILHSWKSYTAKEALKIIRAPEQEIQSEFWQDESYDHIIRSQLEFERQIRYVLENPIKAGFASWKWVGREAGLLPKLFPQTAAEPQPRAMGVPPMLAAGETPEPQHRAMGVPPMLAAGETPEPQHRAMGVPPMLAAGETPEPQHRAMGVPPMTAGVTIIEEISLLEAADEFRAPDRDEKAIPLHASHHDHINAALVKFRESVVAETLQAETVDANQGPNEQKALRYLDGFVSLPFVSEQERALIQAAKMAIRRARFQNLQRQINALQRSTKTVKLTPAALADKLMQILRTYPLNQDTDAPVSATARAIDTTPDIILSESFDSPGPI